MHLDDPIWTLSSKALSPRKKVTLGRQQIGIELELEGFKQGIGHVFKFWTIHDEPSLKDSGAEFVLKHPVPLKTLHMPLTELSEYLATMPAKHSIRTSTHIHVNMMLSTVRQTLQTIACWWLVEDALIATQGPSRQGNLFCLPQSRAEDILQILLYDLDIGEPFNVHQSGNAGTTGYRYAALNFTAIRKFGSLEFRFLQSTTDLHIIKAWCDRLYGFVQTAGKLRVKNIRSLLSIPPIEVYCRLLGDEATNWLLNAVGSDKMAEYVIEARDSVAILLNKLEWYDRNYSREFGSEDDIRHMRPAVVGNLIPNAPPIPPMTWTNNFIYVDEDTTIEPEIVDEDIEEF